MALILSGLCIYVAIVIIVSIIKAIIKLFQHSSTSSTKNLEHKQAFIPSNAPDDLENILRELSNGEIKDPVTQEIFRPGEKVYLCYVHRLAYHEDSWTEIGRKCMVCGNATHTKIHTLSPPLEVRKMDAVHKVEFKNLE